MLLKSLWYLLLAAGVVVLVLVAYMGIFVGLEHY